MLAKPRAHSSIHSIPASHQIQLAPVASPARTCNHQGRRGACGRARHLQVLVAHVAAFVEELGVDELKAQLLDTLFDVERGLRQNNETGAEINELVGQLEANNPTEAPNEAAELLSGTWKLAYTSNSELIPLLGLSRLPLTKVGDIIQIIDATASTFQNKVIFEGPVSRGSFSVNARFQVRSPTKLQIIFDQGFVSAPEITGSPEFPETATLLGRSIDLTSLKDALQPVNSIALNAFGQLRQLVNQQRGVNFDIPRGNAETWLLNTFLDESMRISRGDGGSLFVLVKDAGTVMVDALDLRATALPALPAAGQSSA